MAEQATVNTALMKMSKELNIPLVATNDVHYTYEDDVEAHDLLLCIQTGKKVTDEDRMRYDGGQYYVKSEEEMRALFPYAQEALDNTAKIAERCNVEIRFHETKLPHYEVPEGYTSVSYLHKLCEDGFAKHYPDDDGTLMARMKYELEVIEQMGYVDYFLIVWDFINYAKSNDIMVGPGRGSAAGSIVSYCLHITNIDPIRYQLLFERFLNPERISMPDIDIDFCVERRQEVIDYVGQKYGAEKVVQIVTFGTMAARNAIRDVARVLDLPYALADTIAKMIPQELNITIKKALEMNPELKEKYENDLQIQHLIDMSMRLEGLPRNTSMHAAGVLICPSAADDFVPLSRGGDGAITTQYTMTTLEELGLLKMDFLGLRNLTVIQNAQRTIERTHGIHLVMEEIDYADKKVLDYIGTGKCDGVFQLESGGMKSFMKELKPQSLEDIIAGISLYRPGPMDFIPQYIGGKNNPEAITYLCPELEPILAPTYGCIVYQEQVMQIVRDLGGYTLGRSDEVRRAMSKKKTAVMEKEREYFVYGNKELNIPGCVGNGISADVGNQIYDKMIDFAKYAFNKSHAAAYAVVSYQTAFLKYYYPVEYMAALLTSVISNAGKVSEYIQVAKEMGIKILPPDINEGEVGFSVSDNAIRYALTAIKNVGRPVIEAIVEERKVRGPFTNINDFIVRMADGDVNKRAVENFIKAGAFDSLGGTRKQFLSVYVQAMDRVHKDKKNSMAGQVTLFDLAGDDEKESFEIALPNVGEFNKELLLTFEKEVLGVYISGHPLESYQSLLKKYATNVTTDFYRQEEEESKKDGGGLSDEECIKVRENERVTLGGMITEKRVKYTKNNQMMAYVTLEDLVGSVEVIMFPKAFEKYSLKVAEDAKVFLSGRVQLEDEKDAKLICETVESFSDKPRKLWIKLRNKEEHDALEVEIRELLADSDGRDEVVIYLAEEKQMKSLGRSHTVNAEGILLDLLKEKLGDDSVVVQ